MSDVAEGTLLWQPSAETIAQANLTGYMALAESNQRAGFQGVRMGTSEIYQAVQSLAEVLDSLVIDLETLGGESYLPLFIVLREGAALDDELRQRLKQKIRQEISPRHVPDDIFEIDQIPYTLSGKKMETPIRKILLGQPVEKAANPGTMRNPAALDYFVAFATRLAGTE